MPGPQGDSSSATPGRAGCPDPGDLVLVELKDYCGRRETYLMKVSKHTPIWELKGMIVKGFYGTISMIKLAFGNILLEDKQTLETISEQEPIKINIVSYKRKKEVNIRYNMIQDNILKMCSGEIPDLQFISNVKHLTPDEIEHSIAMQILEQETGIDMNAFAERKEVVYEDSDEIPRELLERLEEVNVPIPNVNWIGDYNIVHSYKYRDQSGKNREYICKITNKNGKKVIKGKIAHFHPIRLRKIIFVLVVFTKVWSLFFVFIILVILIFILYDIYYTSSKRIPPVWLDEAFTKIGVANYHMVRHRELEIRRMLISINRERKRRAGYRPKDIPELCVRIAFEFLLSLSFGYRVLDPQNPAPLPDALK